MVHMNKHLSFIVLFTLLACSCSTIRNVGDGQAVLNKVSITTEGKYKDVSPTNMSLYVRQKGGSSWLSKWKVGLGIEKPVLYDTLLTQRSVAELQGALRSMGYLGSKVEYSVRERKKGRKVDVNYTLHPGEPYTIKSVTYEVEDTTLTPLINLGDRRNQALRPGQRFSLANLDGERKRITDLLLNNGYYRFNKDYITYRADTIRGENSVALTLRLHSYRQNKQSVSHPQYKIGKIAYQSGNPNDTTIRIRRDVLEGSTYLSEGTLFKSSDLRRTYNRFGRMGAVRYTNITFRESADTLTLDCNIQVSTNKPNTISFSPEGTNTAGDLGAAASLTYMQRNLFRGSEQLSIELRGAYEAIRGLDGYDNGDFVEFSVETSLNFPRFIAPFISKRFARRVNASSELSLLYDTQNRPEYHRRVLSAAWRYKWEGAHHHDKYQIDILDINYVFMPWISDTFREEYLENTESRNAILRYNYENLLITKLGFAYNYNNGLHAIRASIETSGNLLSLVSTMVDFERNEDGEKTLFNTAYAQYVKGDFSYTRNIMTGPESSLVLHGALGIAYPYGNSDILPFEKRYFSGGANSVRGWSVRELGPGTYAGSNGKIDFINQTGDIKLYLSMEYRAPLFWKLDGAMFVDAGNIWTIRNYEDQLGGQFHFDKFLEQLAVSYGFGLRLNFNFFILRFDLGMKAVDPAYVTTGEDHFPLVHPDISRDLTFHFAVGLPF